VFTLLSLSVADDPGVWASMGFTVVDGRVRVGSVDIVCTGSVAGEDAHRGITGWTFASPGIGAPSELDGIPVTRVSAIPEAPLTLAHLNGVSSIDHLVVSTPDLDRTVALFEAAGLECRRQRERVYDDNPNGTVRQAFFWLRDAPVPGATFPPERVLCEVVGPKVVDPRKADRPASFFGLAFTSDDLDGTASVMGEMLKPPVTAVQAGRRIATVRSSAGSTVPIAIMSPHIDPDNRPHLDPTTVSEPS
jgi:catechol 2,3-dioxygenase-like lactoylglutathione lyase family enzyme